MNGEIWLGIGELARRAGCKVQTVRYYEGMGLLPPAPRSAGGQRRYRRGDVQRLGFIRHARELGFSLETIGELLDMAARPAESCAAVDHIVRAQLAEVDRRIQQLTALRRELALMVERCAGGPVAECRILEALGEAEASTPPSPPSD